MNPLQEKEIILGISGGIAAYKSAILLREFQKNGANVTVCMTENAKKFITPLTFLTLSKSKVYSKMFDDEEGFNIEHIDLSKKGDILIVAPATANIIGKFASGIADDLLSTLFLSFTGKIFIAPAMNCNMFRNAAVNENLKTLKKRGINIIAPEKGELACGDEGVGRMAEAETILKQIISNKSEKKTIIKKKILITAGPTKEYIDPVRYISNRSSGKMGYALSHAAKDMGMKTTLISGPVSLLKPEGVDFISIETANQMKEEVLKRYKSYDIIIMCAAVSDFSPTAVSACKIKKTQKSEMSLKLKKTPDILSLISSKNKKQTVVGFCAETENLIESAKEKIKRKGLDFIVANLVGKEDTGFDSDYNKVTIINKNLNIFELPKKTKNMLAYDILNKILKQINSYAVSSEELNP